MREYLTTEEAAEYTRISRAKLAKLRYSGSGCKYIKIGDSATKAVIRYRKCDLDAWLALNYVKTTGGL